jgi:hypothetical protein
MTTAHKLTCGSLETSRDTTCRRNGALLVLWCMQYPTALNRQLLSAAMGRCTTTAEPSAKGATEAVAFNLLLGPGPAAAALPLPVELL